MGIKDKLKRTSKLFINDPSAREDVKADTKKEETQKVEEAPKTDETNKPQEALEGTKSKAEDGAEEVGNVVESKTGENKVADSNAADEGQKIKTEAVNKVEDGEHKVEESASGLKDQTHEATGGEVPQEGAGEESKGLGDKAKEVADDAKDKAKSTNEELAKKAESARADVEKSSKKVEKEVKKNDFFKKFLNKFKLTSSAK